MYSSKDMFPSNNVAPTYFSSLTFAVI